MLELWSARLGGCLLIAGVLAIGWQGRAAVHRTGIAILLPAGVTATGLSLALRWWNVGQGPFLTLYEVILSNVFSLGLIQAIAYWRHPALRAGALYATSVTALLAAWALSLPTAVAPLPPSFANPWLWAHVISGKFFLALLSLAAGISVHQIVHRRAPFQEREAHLYRSVWRLSAIAFVFESLMLITGAVWAQDAWGRFWSWDPLESSALLTWIFLAIVLHLRAVILRARTVLLAMICGVFVLAFLTFFGFPFLSLAPHKGVL